MNFALILFLLTVATGLVWALDRFVLARRRAADAPVPAWIEYPIPTPPPWWIDTHVAPAAVFTSAFRSGQSAMASLPSFIFSVSRFGEATEPQSRWSRPMTIGAFTCPVRTSSLNARPAFSRSP